MEAFKRQSKVTKYARQQHAQERGQVQEHAQSQALAAVAQRINGCQLQVSQAKAQVQAYAQSQAPAHYQS